MAMHTSALMRSSFLQAPGVAVPNDVTSLALPRRDTGRAGGGRGKCVRLNLKVPALADWRI